MNSESFEYLSEGAYQEFKKELDCLVRKKRREIILRLEAAKDLGDLSENAEYQEAKEEQLNNEFRIAELEDILSRAVIISDKKDGRVLVELGCAVVLKKHEVEDCCKYQIVGPEETNPLKQKISHESPLGRSLLGRKAGDRIEVLTPAGKIMYTIIEII